jgi:ABC-2 type transport system permease protein
MVLAQTAMELRLTLRRGESLLLTLVIPLALLLFFGTVLDTDLDFLVPGVVTLAVMSTAMTGLAIATGFERQYGVLKRLGATPLPRSGLLLAKTLSVLAVEALQAVLICGVGVALGWSPDVGSWPVFVAVGTAAFAGLGLLMAGTLRAEATLAAANGLYLVLLLVSGLVVPLDGALGTFARWLPSGALAEGLRVGGLRPLAVLAAWTALAVAAAAGTFRWE